MRMRTLIILSLLCSVCTIVHADCASLLENAKRNAVDFPYIEDFVPDSFVMKVEYIVPNLKQSDYYVEYYDTAEREGKVVGQVEGREYIRQYKSQTFEGWEIKGDTCELQNLTSILGLWENSQNEWFYNPEQFNDVGEPIYEKTVWGPSAMFKNAWNVWNTTDKSKMAYMGKTQDKIRGQYAQYWRRCDPEGNATFVDYFFTIDEQEDPLSLGRKRIPLRVYFGGESKEDAFAVEQFEILTFENLTTTGVSPFQLPKGLGCKRWPSGDKIKPPDFSDKNLQFRAEVIYRKIDSNGESPTYWSYYSTLSFTLDLGAQLLAYRFAPWNTSKPDFKNDPESLSPMLEVYDMRHGFAYKTNMTSGECKISRQKSYVPTYKFPEGLGEIALTDQTILFPNSELSYLGKGYNRGLKVDIFEEVVLGYVLDKTKDQIPKAIVTHSYLQNNTREMTTISVKNALSQVNVKLLGRLDKVTEIVTFNFFLFSTAPKNRRFVFNTQKCFENDDDYVWVTIGFSADRSDLLKIQNLIPTIQSNVLTSITKESELNPARIPIILVDFNDGLFVTLLILGKPPILLDYIDPPKSRKTIIGKTREDSVQETEICAQKCLEHEDNCWGFSICGGLCTYGLNGTSDKEVNGNADCKLYRRYDNYTYIPSKEEVVRSIRSIVAENTLALVLIPKEGGMVQLQASSVEVTEPGEDDSIFTRVGNEVNPRMRTFKAGYKLKEDAGTAVRNLGALRFDECQRVCLDFKDCETVSFCMRSSQCIVSSKFRDEIKVNMMDIDDMCTIVTRAYADNFDRSPGNVLSLTAQEVLPHKTVEECARACLKASGYKCLSFDHCPQDSDAPCKLHTVHYVTSKTREAVQRKSSNCGHYFRKFSTEFKKTPNKQTIGASLVPLFNMTLEECSKACKEYGKGTCFGFDFCQDANMLATTCTLLDSDPSKLKSVNSDRCTNFLRTEPQFAPRPYTSGYAGGIGFLCFLIGLAVGALTVFGIAYFKVNRR